MHDSFSISHGTYTQDRPARSHYTLHNGRSSRAPLRKHSNKKRERSSSYDLPEKKSSRKAALGTAFFLRASSAFSNQLVTCRKASEKHV